MHLDGNTGPPLLLLHGVGGGAWSWAPQATAFADSHRVYRWEARGHGAAPRVMDAGFADYVCDAREALDLVLEQTGERPIVVAHSMGGYIGTILAAEQRPLAGLALIDPVYADDARTHVTPALQPLARVLMRPLVASAKRDGLLIRVVARALFRLSFTQREACERYWRLQRAQVPLEYPRMFWEGISGVEGIEIRPYARDVRVPTLLFNGRFPNLVAELQASLGARFSNEHLPGGHYLQLDRPDEVNERLRRFFGEACAS